MKFYETLMDFRHKTESKLVLWRSGDLVRGGNCRSCKVKQDMF